MGPVACAPWVSVRMCQHAWGSAVSLHLPASLASLVSLHLGPICTPKRKMLPDPGMVLTAWEPRLVMRTPMT